MVNDKPLVSIGMPVYNGERYIRQTLDSLLAQDYTNMELVISDNASTDRTGEICQEYVLRDKRISYHRTKQNMGAVWNFNRVAELSKGKYFMWAAAHDLWDPTFISHCVPILEIDPHIVLAYSQTMRIGPEGEQLQTDVDSIDTRGIANPAMRLRLTWWGHIRCLAVYGLIRTSALRKSHLMRKAPNPDKLILAELSLLGTFAHIPKLLFYLRVTWGVLLVKEYRRRQAEAVAQNRIRRLVWTYLYHLYKVLQYWRLIYHTKLGVKQKTRLVVDGAYYFAAEFFSPKIMYKLLPRKMQMLIRRLVY